jgi:AraC family transcriptional regulator
MQDTYSLCKHLLTASVLLLEGYQINAFSTMRGTPEIIASELAGVPDAHESSPETLQCAVAILVHAVSRILQEKTEEARQYLLHAADLLRIEPASAIASLDPDARSAARPTPRGGLAPWVVCKVSTYIETHLDSAISTADLAALAKLSTYHFCRAFRQSFDAPPHAYVMRRRMERAQSLMLQTDLPLAQIAMDCGWADQAHLNKSFRRFVGQSPGAWRRARVVGLR